ncbi:MAG: chitinase [Thermoanaerobacterium sp.]|nr:chitinase [Thermoanaerobacterium sp.]MDI3529466.1 chitinase [Thermoanaerobacter sp.]
MKKVTIISLIFLVNIFTVAFAVTGPTSSTTTGTTTTDMYGSTSNYTTTYVYTVPTSAPSAPQGLVSSNVTNNSVTLTWKANSDADQVFEYDIYENNTKIGSTTNTSFVIDNLMPGVQYSFYITAVNIVGESAPSTILNATTLIQAYDAPKNLEVTNISDDSISLKWQGKQGPYDVFLNDNIYSLTDNTELTITGLQPETTYSIYISSANNQSLKSNLVTVNTAKTIQPVDANSLIQNSFSYIRGTGPFLLIALSIIFTFLIVDGLIYVYRAYF